jgi:hypothetical protein
MILLTKITICINAHSTICWAGQLTSGWDIASEKSVPRINNTFSKYSQLHDTHFIHLWLHLSKQDLNWSWGILRFVFRTTIGKSWLSLNSCHAALISSQTSHGARSREWICRMFHGVNFVLKEIIICYI